MTDMIKTAKRALGLVDLTNLNDDEEFPEESVKTRTWQFMAGFGFPLGG